MFDYKAIGEAYSSQLAALDEETAAEMMAAFLGYFGPEKRARVVLAALASFLPEDGRGKDAILSGLFRERL